MLMEDGLCFKKQCLKYFCDFTFYRCSIPDEWCSYENEKFVYE
ncbi:hypothetical protein [Helicobacter rodentium]|nr:hypothetical protein [Helicobacter rodentium]